MINGFLRDIISKALPLVTSRKLIKCQLQILGMFWIQSLLPVPWFCWYKSTALTSMGIGDGLFWSPIYPNSVVQHGISFMKFYSNRNKVINENTFQIHHWALCGWVLVLGEGGENPVIGFRWYLRASLALWLVKVGFYWVTAFQQVFICQSQDVRFDFVSHRSFCPTRSGWGMALSGFTAARDGGN